jgi:hypothetical protein
MHVFTVHPCNRMRSLGLGLCLTALLLAGCSDDSPTTLISPTTPTAPKTLRFAYVPNIFSNNVSAYTIDATTGALTAVAGSPFAAGSWPDRISLMGF